MQLEEEGCLSVPGFNATVVRPTRAVVEGPGSPRRAAAASRERDCSRARSSTRWIIWTARCSSIACAGIKRDLIVRKIRKLTRAGKW